MYSNKRFDVFIVNKEFEEIQKTRQIFFRTTINGGNPIKKEIGIMISKLDSDC